MMRAAAAKVASQRDAAPSAVAAAIRCYMVPQSVSFTEDVAIPKPAVKDTVPILDCWNTQKAETEHLLKLLQAYKDVGNSNNEPLLKYHNPRTFEDMTKPVPNFRAMSLKPGEVPRFFDSVLMGRAADAVAKKEAWWAQRKQEVEDNVKGKSSSALPTVPVPTWSYGKAVPMDSLKAVTDAYIAAQEPKRKLQLAEVPAQVKDSLAAFAKSLQQEGAASQVADLVVSKLADSAVVVENGKPLEGFKYISKAAAAKVVAARRAQVHQRYLKLWAKKLLVSPELAAVPLKEVDAQLASKFESVSPTYADVLSAAGAGPKTLGERVAGSPAFSNFFLKREQAAEVAAELGAPSEAEAQGAALAAKFEDPAAALTSLLGPEISPLGAGGAPLSAQVRAITEHRFTPDRYAYKEGMKLAARLEADEAAAAAAGLDPAAPPTPVQQVMERMKSITGLTAKFEADKKAADSPYMAYVLAKKQEFACTASNLPLEELEAPEVVTELMDMELAELAEAEKAIDDAEEEELWALTLAAQLKHLQKHFGVDLPHGVIAHMDPILIKKIDWETTNSLEDWDITLEDLGAEYAKEQWGLETLSHHFLPLIRYRRAKARAAGVKFDPELVAPLR